MNLTGMHTFAHLMTPGSRIGSLPSGSMIDPFTGKLNIDRLGMGHICAIEGGEDDPPAPAKSDKTFTQEDVDKIVAKRVKSVTKRAEQAEAKLDKMSESQTAMQSKLDELDDKLNAANKSEDAKELQKLQRRFAQMEEHLKTVQAEKEEAESLAKQSSEGLTSFRTNSLLTEALLGAGAHKRGIKRAVAALRADGAVTHDDDGNLVVTVGGVPFDNVGEAAKKWLSTEENEMFAEGMGSGSGAPRAGGAQRLTSEQMSGMRPGSLIQVGLGQSPPKSA